MAGIFGAYTAPIAKLTRRAEDLRKSGYPFDGQQSFNDIALLEGQQFLHAPEAHEGLRPLAQLLGMPDGAIREPVTGDHPDFAIIRQTGRPTHHYIVSAFFDVKNSTTLYNRYSVEAVGEIINLVVNAALHTCALFGGHIQRIQGDGVFVYFGGKGVAKSDAVDHALQAAAFFSFFMKYELQEVLDTLEGDTIYTRIGLDFGDDRQVEWRINGSSRANELTTNSFFTNMASKLQAQASNFGIMVGNNAFERMNELAQEHTDFLRVDRNVDETRRYVWHNPRYAQRAFNWQAYLRRRYPFVKRSSDGKLYIEYANAASTATNAGLFVGSTGIISSRPSGVPVTNSNRFHSDLP